MRNFVRVHPRVRPGSISIVVPTLASREHHLKRCMETYEAATTTPYELLIVRDQPGCGRAWNIGAQKALGEYLHFTADDLEPLPGWDTAAIAAVEGGHLPAPVTFDAAGVKIESAGGHWDRVPPDGETTLGTCTIPFLPTADWPRVGPIIEAHYYTDNHFSDRARAAGWDFAVTWAYAFKHHWAKEGRGEEGARMETDREIYRKARIP